MLSATSIAARVRSGEFDPQDVTEEAIHRLQERDPEIHAYLDPDIARARQLAERVAETLRRGGDPGRLAGVPISLKDNMAVSGATLSAGSRILEGYRAPYDSFVAQRLLAEGAVLLGLVGLLLFRVWRIGQMADDRFGLLVSAGVFSMLLFQVFQSVGMSTGIMPITGIPFPLVSYGGSSLLTTFVSVGLVQSVHMRRHERQGRA